MVSYGHAKIHPLLINLMIVFPNAKINIGINITSRRTDGYHNIETIFYPVNIFDALEAPLPANKLTFDSSGVDIPGRTEDNLCIKGYHLINKDYKLLPLNIHLHKNIPIGARAWRRLCRCRVFYKTAEQPVQFEAEATDQMMDYARVLGVADCAFFIENKPLFAFEKGDQFETIKLDLSKYHMVLVMPPAHVSTSEGLPGC